MVLSIKDNYIYTEMMKGKGEAEKAFTEGAKAGLQIARQRTNTGGVTGAEFKTPRYGPGGYEEVPFVDGVYRGPTIPNPNRGLPGQGFDWAHSPMEVDSLVDKWGAVWDGKDNRWLMPPDSPNGNYRPATDEEAGMLNEDFQHRQMYDRNQPHPNQNMANVWSHETESDTFNRQNYPGRDASDALRIKHMLKYHDMKKRELASSDYFPIDLLENPADTVDGPLDVMDFPSGGNYRKGSDVLDELIRLEKVKINPKKKKNTRTT